MTDSEAALSIGDRDPNLAEILDRGLDEYNFAATGTSKADQDSFSIKVSTPTGEIIGGLTAWTWAGLCGISMLWVHQDHRKAGWGAKILVHVPSTGFLPEVRLYRDWTHVGHPRWR
jgi:hypothetical protein